MNASSQSIVISGHDAVTLPRFIRIDQAGLWFRPSLIPPDMPSDDSFVTFVDRIFMQKARFAGLDYAWFQRLLYAADTLDASLPDVLLATGVVPFAAERLALYKDVRIANGGMSAEYMFQPMFVEVSYEDPQYGRPDASGAPTIVGYRTKTRFDPTQLDMDELIAFLWTKGVRFGIQVAAVQSAVHANKMARVTVACGLEAMHGRDAGLVEVCDGLHRDNSPLITNEKANLRRFKNRFPQIARGQRMLKKEPAQAGTRGYTVSGDAIVPIPPKDLDLAAIAGPGTQIETTADGLFITAASDGFISVDVESNQISITAKIENKGGISARTTGDLTLTVDEFVEHGEVQEGRIVDGKHMKFTATVHGSLVSDAGRIELDANLIGGSAISHGGSIVLQGRASNARVETPGGSMKVHYAENSILIGTDITLQHGINCTVVADKVSIGLARGCTIAAQSIHIDQSDARRETATLILVLVPDMADVASQVDALRKAVADLTHKMEKKSADIKQFSTDPDFAKFLSIREMVRSGNVTISPALENNFRQMQGRHTNALKILDKLTQEKQALSQSIAGKRREILQLKEQQTALAARITCSIASVIGETCVQQLRTRLGPFDCVGLTANDIDKQLRAGSADLKRIFLDTHGSLTWNYVHPQDDPTDG